MLKRNRTRAGQLAGARFAIVASRYNPRYVDGLLKGAQRRLEQATAGAPLVVRVPGAFEIPLVAATLARGHRPRLEAILCLGVIIRGETTHAEFIGQAVTASLARIQLDEGVPIIHEVLLLENEEQAKVRCLGRKYHRGIEAANTALEMADLFRKLGESR